MPNGSCENELLVDGYDHFTVVQADLLTLLAERVGETLIIGDDVHITVLGVKGNQVRIGINAPKSVSVHREEIYDRIRQEKDSAAGGE